jgi:hypothetical protein
MKASEYFQKRFLRTSDIYSSELGQDKINWLDTYRLECHESFYGLEKSNADEHEAEDAFEKSEKFLKSIQQILSPRSKK